MEDKNYYSRTGYVSNSSLNYLIKSPKLFKQYLDGLTKEESKKYFEFGQLVHLKILEPQEFKDTVLVFDYETPRSAQQKGFIEELAIDLNIYDIQNYKGLDEALIEHYKRQYATKESDEKVLVKATKLFKQFDGYFKYLKIKDSKSIISTTDFKKIEEMEANCRAHKAANGLLFDPVGSKELDTGVEAFNEYEVLWDYNGVPCKSLIDRHIIDYNTKTIKLVDFKTTGKLHDFKSSFKDFGYDRQLVFYGMALGQSLIDTIGPDLDNWTFEYYIEACDSRTHEVISFKIEEEDLVEAREKITDLFNRAKWHIDNDKWDHSMEYYLGDGNERLC